MNSDEIRGSLVGLILLAWVGLVVSQPFYMNKKHREQKRTEFLNRANTGITHQYLDTNQNGMYDLYRYTQKGSETMLIDYNGDGEYDSQQVVNKSRVFSGNLDTEMSQEECEREYRPGNIEFKSLE